MVLLNLSGLALIPISGLLTGNRDNFSRRMVRSTISSVDRVDFHINREALVSCSLRTDVDLNEEPASKDVDAKAHPDKTINETEKNLNIRETCRKKVEL